MLSIEEFARFPELMGGDPVYFPVGYLFLLGEPALWRAFQEQAEM